MEQNISTWISSGQLSEGNKMNPIPNHCFCRFLFYWIRILEVLLLKSAKALRVVTAGLLLPISKKWGCGWGSNFGYGQGQD